MEHRAYPAKVLSEDTLRDPILPPSAEEENSLVHMKPGQSSISPEMRVNSAIFSSFSNLSCVSDPDPHESAERNVSWIRIRMDRC